MPARLRRYLQLVLIAGPLSAAGCRSAPPSEPRHPAPVDTGLQLDLVFSNPSPLATGAEITRRLMSPLTALRFRERAAATGKVLPDQSVDPAKERFALYVPAHPPPGGYGLMVFVPPWEQAVIQYIWMPALERHAMIMVSAGNSGNDASTLDRRVPLALLAIENVRRRYPVDPVRIYVGGFSGGSIVALRLAVGYPDLFKGALLAAGSATLGDEVPLPPADLFHRFQESSRVVFLTGALDQTHLAGDGYSRASLDRWCVSGVVTDTVPGLGHALADSAWFSRALDDLTQPMPPDPAALARCRARTEAGVAAQLQQAEELTAAGQTGRAAALLDRLDRHYGGLAAPKGVTLAERLRALR